MAHLMPIPLRYAAARTHRFGGEWSINFQNLVRGSPLRSALCAPPGFEVVAADYAQIEARLVAWLCGASELLQAFATKQDPYVLMESHIFSRQIDKVKDPPFFRFVGKAAVLGLGYGMGANKFYYSVLRTARAQGQDMSLLKQWTPELAQHAVDVYRRVNSSIPAMWRLLDRKLHGEWLGNVVPSMVGPFEIGHGYIKGPSGLKMNYANPRLVDGELWYDYGRTRSKLYGAAALENASQHLARVIIMNAAMRLNSLGYRMVHQVHDELIFIIDRLDLDNALHNIHTQMIQLPSWAPDLPLAVDIGHGENYGRTK